MNNNVKKEFVPCPVCEELCFPKDDFPGSYIICKKCGWEDDDLQYYQPDYEGGANELSLNQYKKMYEQRIKLC